MPNSNNKNTKLIIVYVTQVIGQSISVLGRFVIKMPVNKTLEKNVLSYTVPILGRPRHTFSKSTLFYLIIIIV